MTQNYAFPYIPLCNIINWPYYYSTQSNGSRAQTNSYDCGAFLYFVRTNSILFLKYLYEAARLQAEGLPCLHTQVMGNS